MGIYFGALGAMMALFGTLSVLPPYRQPVVFVGVLAGVLWLLAALLFYGAARSRTKRALYDVRITPQGVMLSFEDGYKLEEKWADPRFGLTLRDYSIDPLSSDESTDHVALLAPLHRFGTVPPGVAGTLTRAAREQGVPVETRREAIATGKSVHLALTTRIGQIEQTPDWKGHERPAR